MGGKYDDIIGMEHHRSTRHAPLSTESRAAQFAPFAALTGYDEAIVEAGRRTEGFLDLDEDQKAILDVKWRLLEEREAEKPEVTIRYFLPDERKEGGSYLEVSGRLQKIDKTNRMIYLEQGEGIPIERIVELGARVFEAGE